MRLGILDNSKWNANKLLRGASAALGEDIKFAAVNYYVKQSFSKDAAPELIEQIARENDIVLTAIGDCGSCCSCCIRDSVALEKLGIPSAAIITTEFVGETELTRRALGMPDLEPVVIDHPVSSITQDEVDARVRQIKERAQRSLDGRMTVGIQVDEQRPLTACVLSCKRGVSMPISPIWVRCMKSGIRPFETLAGYSIHLRMNSHRALSGVLHWAARLPCPELRGSQ